MIYRLLSDREEAVFDEATGLVERFGPSGSGMGGVFSAGVGEGFHDMPFPLIEHPRARFWFTEDGWKSYGRHVHDAAVRRGHVVRVIRRKNPPRSQVVYRDRYQVAILPPEPDRHRA